MEFEYNYKFIDICENDLDEIISYFINELKSKQTASDFISELTKVIENIRLFPNSGELVNNSFIKIKGIRKKYINNYTLFYLTKKKEKIIYLLRIVYSRRNLDYILSNIVYSTIK